MQNQLKCPACGLPLSPEDTHVIFSFSTERLVGGKNILCRQCGCVIWLVLDRETGKALKAELPMVALLD